MQLSLKSVRKQCAKPKLETARGGRALRAGGGGGAGGGVGGGGGGGALRRACRI